MRSLKLLIVATLQLASFCALFGANTEALPTTAVPFQLISPVEFKAILELSNGNPFITQNRLISSGSKVVTDIINNIVNGLISPVNITGLDSIYNSILKPSHQGYPFCAIQTNRNAQHSQRSYDAVVDSAGNFGSFSINFYHPGTVNIDNYDEDITIDELEPNYHNQKPSQAESPTMANYRPVYGSKDKPDNNVAPVINCIVVLKEPSQPATRPPTTTHRPSKRPSMQPSFYPQYPSMLMPSPHHPRDTSYSIGPFQIVPIPYLPFLGLIGPASGTSNFPNWAGSQAFPSNNPNSLIPPSWPYWPVAAPSIATQGNKNPQTAPTWPYLGIPSQPASSHVPTTSPYMPGSFWTTINPDIGNAAPSPSISIHSNPTAWFRPPAGAFNANHLMQQQNYNQNAGDDEIRSAATHDEIPAENKENQVDTLVGDENVAGAMKSPQKQKSRRMDEDPKI